MTNEPGERRRRREAERARQLAAGEQVAVDGADEAGPADGADRSDRSDTAHAADPRDGVSGRSTDAATAGSATVVATPAPGPAAPATLVTPGADAARPLSRRELRELERRRAAERGEEVPVDLPPGADRDGHGPHGRRAADGTATDDHTSTATGPQPTATVPQPTATGSQPSSAGVLPAQRSGLARTAPPSPGAPPSGPSGDAADAAARTPAPARPSSGPASSTPATLPVQPSRAPGDRVEPRPAAPWTPTSGTVAPEPTDGGTAPAPARPSATPGPTTPRPATPNATPTGTPTLTPAATPTSATPTSATPTSDTPPVAAPDGPVSTSDDDVTSPGPQGDDLDASDDPDAPHERHRYTAVHLVVLLLVAFVLGFLIWSLVDAGDATESGAATASAVHTAVPTLSSSALPATHRGEL